MTQILGINLSMWVALFITAYMLFSWVYARFSLSRNVDWQFHLARKRDVGVINRESRLYLYEMGRSLLLSIVMLYQAIWLHNMLDLGVPNWVLFVLGAAYILDRLYYRTAMFFIVRTTDQSV